MTNQRKIFVLKGFVLRAGAVLGAVLVLTYALALTPDSMAATAKPQGLEPIAPWKGLLAGLYGGYRFAPAGAAQCLRPGGLPPTIAGQMPILSK